MSTVLLHCSSAAQPSWRVQYLRALLGFLVIIRYLNPEKEQHRGNWDMGGVVLLHKDSCDFVNVLLGKSVGLKSEPFVGKWVIEARFLWKLGNFYCKNMCSCFWLISSMYCATAEHCVPKWPAVGFRYVFWFVYLLSREARFSMTGMLFCHYCNSST